MEQLEVVHPKRVRWASGVSVSNAKKSKEWR
jgi:hypothetical protein